MRSTIRTRSRSIVLIACAGVVFWPGAFIFGFPGVLRQHWQEAFAADAGAIGQVVFYIWLWAVLSAVIGFAFGTLFAVLAPLAADCFGMTHFGAVFGLIFTAYGFLSGPLGPWLSGHLLDLSGGNYTIVFSYLGMMYLIAAGIILMVRPWRECRL